MEGERSVERFEEEKPVGKEGGGDRLVLLEKQITRDTDVINTSLNFDPQTHHRADKEIYLPPPVPLGNNAPGLRGTGMLSVIWAAM